MKKTKVLVPPFNSRIPPFNSSVWPFNPMVHHSIAFNCGVSEFELPLRCTHPISIESQGNLLTRRNGIKSYDVPRRSSMPRRSYPDQNLMSAARGRISEIPGANYNCLGWRIPKTYAICSSQNGIDIQHSDFLVRMMQSSTNGGRLIPKSF
jgi:hypothetical protein